MAGIRAQRISPRGLRWEASRSEKADSAYAPNGSGGGGSLMPSSFNRCSALAGREPSRVTICAFFIISLPFDLNNIAGHNIAKTTEESGSMEAAASRRQHSCGSSLRLDIPLVYGYSFSGILSRRLRRARLYQAMLPVASLLKPADVPRS